MPYDKTLKYGWMWTYATLLAYNGTAQHPNSKTKGVLDEDLIDCVCMMMRHRPADRIELAELRTIAKRKLNELDQPPDEPYKVDSLQSRDQDQFTDEALRNLHNMLTGGVPDFTYGRISRANVIPFPEAEVVDGDGNMLPDPLYQEDRHYVRAVRGDRLDTAESNRTSKWKTDHLRRLTRLPPPPHSQTPLPSAS
ncbi:hypothetical protein HMPREF1624_01865 [Sporothrix schenckii ATCC 58251]|uniref:Protein kinase domain-containing protein n=1 Tax=Sporothrix schenckii (strain ATCC 58251 / de Perez 2211183) TaxID=1391915 RepID=U7PYG0_SPOS1|nr:hypothetical protein HMPREF1624_01865 [Sporothrix schenckii ATCC 58251]